MHPSTQSKYHVSVGLWETGSSTATCFFHHGRLIARCPKHPNSPWIVSILKHETSWWLSKAIDMITRTYWRVSKRLSRIHAYTKENLENSGHGPCVSSWLQDKLAKNDGLSPIMRIRQLPKVRGGGEGSANLLRRWWQRTRARTLVPCPRAASPAPASPPKQHPKKYVHLHTSTPQIDASGFVARPWIFSTTRLPSQHVINHWAEQTYSSRSLNVGNHEVDTLWTRISDMVPRHKHSYDHSRKCRVDTLVVSFKTLTWLCATFAKETR